MGDRCTSFVRSLAVVAPTHGASWSIRAVPTFAARICQCTHAEQRCQRRPGHLSCCSQMGTATGLLSPSSESRSKPRTKDLGLSVRWVNPTSVFNNLAISLPLYVHI